MQRPTSDLLRILAMAAVVVIHSGGQATRGWHPGADWSTSLAAVLDQVARFCVPVFVLLSGFGLVRRDQERIRRSGTAVAEPLWTFYAPRLLRTGLPLLVFSLAMLGLHLGESGLSAARFQAFPRQVLTGSADYHLYFLPIIIGCYVAYPLLRRIGPGRALVVLAPWYVLLCQPCNQLASWIVDLQIGIPGWSPLRYLPWFAFGMWAASLPDTIAPGPGKRFIAWALALATATWVVWEFLAGMRTPGMQADWIQHYSRLSVTAYALAIWYWFRVHDQPLTQWLATPVRAAWLARFAAWSFAVFLIHPWILRLLAPTPIAAWPQVQAVVVGITAVALVAALDRFVAWNPARLALGLESRREKTPPKTPQKAG